MIISVSLFTVICSFKQLVLTAALWIGKVSAESNRDLMTAVLAFCKFIHNEKYTAAMIFVSCVCAQAVSECLSEEGLCI